MRWRRFCPAWLLLISLSCMAGAADEASPPRTGTVQFVPTEAEAALPDHFRMQEHSFDFAQTPVKTSGDVMRVSKVTFPSPMVTPHPNNNTVHCEYFRPTAPGKKPGVIVLHILGGDFDLARLFCRSLATKNISALFLKMPYYGERQQPGVSVKMISPDPYETIRGMTQAVLDIRHAAAWLAAQEEVDESQLGIMGISLGGITGSLAISVEPRFAKGCFLLAGGDMAQIAQTSTEMAELRKYWEEKGGNFEEMFAALKAVDPVTYAKPVPGRKILMLNAANDEVVPPACTKSLWRAFGEPEIVWWDAGHYTAVRYIFPGMVRVVSFFGSDAAPNDTAPAGGAQSTAK